jgi:hypothetical protein
MDRHTGKALTDFRDLAIPQVTIGNQYTRVVLADAVGDLAVLPKSPFTVSAYPGLGRSADNSSSHIRQRCLGVLAARLAHPEPGS